ncbi:MAG TPA: hypothetical protein EYP85_07720 [Armatimonadetes bacterium]|nr:hypothetical protein [Armatimonadota bacterium]
MKRITLSWLWWGILVVIGDGWGPVRGEGTRPVAVLDFACPDDAEVGRVVAQRLREQLQAVPGLEVVEKAMAALAEQGLTPAEVWQEVAVVLGRRNGSDR